MKYIKIKDYRINLEKLVYYKAYEVQGGDKKRYYINFTGGEGSHIQIEFNLKSEQDEVTKKLDEITLSSETAVIL